tara:strand:- start:1604 stop:2005 length:402 start_codon:yes stop_codon:yes gene_type:complete
MKITKQRLKEIIKEELNEVLQDAGGVWVIEADDERYLQSNRESWGPLWSRDQPEVIGAAVFGDETEAEQHLDAFGGEELIRARPRFFSDDDLEKMELPVEEPPSEEEEQEAYPAALKAMAIQRAREKRAWKDT